jgi:hypothetical protein
MVDPTGVRRRRPILPREICALSPSRDRGRHNETPNALNPSNRRVRTRTHGGVGGEESRDSPLIPIVRLLPVIATKAAMGAADATKESTHDDRSRRTWLRTAASLIPDRSPTHRTPARRLASLVLGQQTIGAIRCGTLMRHVVFAHPMAARARRMIGAAVTAPLVTTTGFALRASARFPGAACGAINMAAIAMTADQYLDPAALTQEQSRRHSIGMVVAIPARLRGLRPMPWMQSLPGTMMPLHSCSGTV